MVVKVQPPPPHPALNSTVGWVDMELEQKSGKEK